MTGIDATMPCASLGLLRYEAFLVHVSNVYDNPPTDEVAQPSGRTHHAQTHPYLDDATVADLDLHSLSRGRLPSTERG